MKVLTVCQPYAELIASGAKWVENRTWATSYRGPLAVHAGRSRLWLEPGDERVYPQMAFGAIVAVADLVDVVRLDVAPPRVRRHEHAAGPWCWILRGARRLRRPVPFIGRLQLRPLDAATRAAVAEALR